MNHSDELLRQNFGIDAKILDLVKSAEAEIQHKFQELDDIMAYNQYKILSALQENKLSDMHFGWNTGYGYDDPGRDAIERIYADIFHTDSALVRPTIVNGTHALAITLLGVLRPGDELIYCTGRPYDTLEEVIGLRGSGNGSLRDYGISYKQVDLLPDGSIDLGGIKKAVSEKTRMVTVQRATGYGWRKAITIEQIEEWARFVSGLSPHIVKMVDNCYGEFPAEAWLLQEAMWQEEAI